MSIKIPSWQGRLDPNIPQFIYSVATFEERLRTEFLTREDQKLFTAHGNIHIKVEEDQDKKRFIDVRLDINGKDETYVKYTTITGVTKITPLRFELLKHMFDQFKHSDSHTCAIVDVICNGYSFLITPFRSCMRKNKLFIYYSEDFLLPYNESTFTIKEDGCVV